MKRFSDIADIEIVVENDCVVILPRGKVGKNKSAPLGLMCAAFMIRHALSFATMHHVVMRSIFDLDEKFVCCLMYVGNSFGNQSEIVNYLGSVGFGEERFDLRRVFQDAAGAYSGGVRKWLWQTVPNRRRVK